MASTGWLAETSHIGRSRMAAVLVALLLGGCKADARDIAAKFVEPASPNASLFQNTWSFRNEHGESVRFETYRGTPLVVSAIYTTCNRVCPRTVADLRAMHTAFERAGKHPQFLLVTLDPETDTPARLLEYKREKKLPESWHLLTTTEAQTKQIVEFLEFHTMRMDDHVYHSGNIAIFATDGKPVTRFGNGEYDDLLPEILRRWPRISTARAQ